MSSHNFYNMQSAFLKVKPLCDNIAKFGSIEDINRLENTLNDIDDDTLLLLQEYLLFPINLLFCKRGKEKQIIKCVNFMKYVFSRTGAASKNIFSQNFLQLFSLISVPEDINKVSDASEELKFAICESVSALVLNSSEEILEAMYSSSFRLPLAQSFFVLSTLLSHERSKTLRKVLLQLIGILTYSSEYVKDRNEKIEELASHALTSFFPGISIALHKVICGDNKQGHLVIIIALRILADLVVLVVNDSCYKGRNLLEDNSTTIDDVPVIIKNNTWFKEVSSKMKILIKNVTVVVGHDNWRVRLAFLNFSKSILFNCTQSLEDCVPILLPAVFALSVDDYEGVSSCSQNLVKKFTQHFQLLNSYSLLTIIEDDIYASTSKLMRSKLSASDNQKLCILKTLQGYIQILGPSVNNLLFSMPRLERIILCLINILEFDISTIHLVEEVTVTPNIGESISPLWPRKKFVYFENEEILNTICNICNILGCVGNIRLLIDYLMQQLKNSNLYALQSIYLMGNIIKGISNKLSPLEECIELVGDIIDELLSPSVWELSVHETDHQKLITKQDEPLVQNSALSFKAYNGNIHQICLILETFAKCAETLKEHFKIHLKKILCPVMERAGSSNFTLSQSGKLCFYSIAKSCNYTSVSELIKENSDYLVNSITIHFHHYLCRPEVAVVLRVAMEESDVDALTLFSDCIFQILNILDYNQDKAYALLKVLFSVVVCIIRWFPSTKKTGSSMTSKKCENLRDLKTALLEHQEQRKAALNFLSENFEEDGTVEEEQKTVEETYELEEEKEVVPLHVNIVKEILKRCIHLQSCRNLYLRMLALETVESCVLAIRDFENHLHPLVHELWNPFVQRFSEDVVVIVKAFSVLLVIANECQDFVRVRTLRDVVPKLIDFLKKEYNCSLLKSGFRNYQWTNAHKLQLSLLSEMGNLYTYLDVGEKDIAILAEVCLPYLNNKQPKILQDAAAKSVKALGTIDSDAMWLYYNNMYSEVKVLKPPHESLSLLYFPHSSGSDTSVKIVF